MAIPLPPAKVLSSQTPVQNSISTKLKVKVVSRLAVYRNKIYLANKFLETHDQ
jgi:hypothetical protein